MSIEENSKEYFNAEENIESQRLKALLGFQTKEGKELLIKLRPVISNKEMKKRRLYKIKTYDGKIKKVEWYQLPVNRREQILEGEDTINFFMTMFPILVLVISIISVCIHIFN